VAGPCASRDPTWPQPLMNQLPFPAGIAHSILNGTGLEADAVRAVQQAA
jgi:hypothetical protein